MPGPDRKRRLTTLAVALTVLIVTPLAVVASHQFTDVPDSNIFHADIDWLADNGITLGCNPPDNDEFCPSENVTRQQMAAFMHRLAENEVVNAATANEADHAADSDTVDSLHANEIVRAAGGDIPGDEQNYDGTPLTDEITIVAPTNGLLLISYTNNHVKDPDSTSNAGIRYYPAMTEVDGASVGGTVWSNIDFACSAAQSCDYKSMSFQKVVPVEEGTHNVAVTFGQGPDATRLLVLFDRSLTALFVPFDAEGDVLSTVASPQSEPAPTGLDPAGE